MMPGAYGSKFELANCLTISPDSRPDSVASDLACRQLRKSMTPRAVRITGTGRMYSYQRTRPAITPEDR